ncbi:MAG: hypothetical protein E7007_01190 [Alphaproteobacteria bacterium]|nr:hypothetical protein [Alphaproteobacteria bacterium]
MRTSYNDLLNFVPRIIVGLVLTTMVCTNTNAETVSTAISVYRCNDQSKCANIQPESGTCNYYTIGQATSDGVLSNGSPCATTLCTAGTWYCLGSAAGDCAVYDCTACSGAGRTCSTHNYELTTVNSDIAVGAPCNYVLGGTSEPLVIHGCALKSCRAGYYKTLGRFCTVADTDFVVGGTISGVDGTISGVDSTISGAVRPAVLKNICCQCPSNSTSLGNNEGGKGSCECITGYYGDPGNGVACTQCPAGSTTISKGMTSVNNCVCKAGFYGSGGNFCNACPSGYTSAQGAAKITECYRVQQVEQEDGTGYFEYTDECYYPNK